MIRKILVIIFCLFSLRMIAEKRIQMEQDGSIYRLQCKVNGAKIKLVFDTGASTVSLSLPLAQYLYDNDFISDDDFRGVGQSLVADGQIVDHLKLNIKDIEISGVHIKDIDAIVIASQDAPLLLGQSAIQKLGRIQLTGNNLILLDIIDTIPYRPLEDEEEIDGLVAQADEYYFNELYGSALPIYSLLQANDILNEIGKERLAMCYLQNQQPLDCINVLDTMDEWKYNLYGLAYDMNGDRDNAIVYFNRYLDLCQSNNDYSGMADAYGNLATIYDDWRHLYKKDYRKSVECIRNALKYYELAKDFSKGSIWKHCVGVEKNNEIEKFRRENPTLDFLIYQLSEGLYQIGDWSFEEMKNTKIALAKNNNKVAQDICDRLYWYY